MHRYTREDSTRSYTLAKSKLLRLLSFQ